MPTPMTMVPIMGLALALAVVSTIGQVQANNDTFCHELTLSVPSYFYPDFWNAEGNWVTVVNSGSANVRHLVRDAKTPTCPTPNQKVAKGMCVPVAIKHLNK